MEYLFVKWLHILSATVLFGTGVGSAFYMWRANASKDLPSIFFAVRTVVVADWLFTTPAVIAQLLSGLYMVDLIGLAWGQSWIRWALALYFFAGACWLPVVWIQIKMRRLAEEAMIHQQGLPPAYWRLSAWWTMLGCLAFPAIVAVFYLMVFKPNF